MMKSNTVLKKSLLDTINQLQLAIKSAGVYPEDHPITIDIINNAFDALSNHLTTQNALTLCILGNKLLVDDLPLETQNNLAASFALDLDQRAISSISFCRGLSRRDYLIFIKAMTQKPLPKSKQGDVASILKNNGVSAIRLNEITYARASADAPVQPPPPAQLTPPAQPAPASSERKVHDLSKCESATDAQSMAVECINDLFSGGKSKGLETLCEDITSPTNDQSGDMRKRIAEQLEHTSLALDEVDTLKDNFQKILDTLVNWIKNESDADTYLAVTRSMRNICTSLNRLERYLVGETVGSRLFETNNLTQPKLQEALKARKKNGSSLQYNLGALQLVDEEVLVSCLAQQYKRCAVINLSSIQHVDEQILNSIPEKYVQRYHILPFKADSANLHVATMNPDDWQVIKDIRFISGQLVIPHLATEYHLLKAIEKFYSIEPLSSMQQEEWNSELEVVELKQETEEFTEELNDSEAPIIKLAHVILDEAIKQNVSDIHIEPYESELRVRLRIDGTLITVLTPSKSYASGLSSRIKIMSGLDISERRLPQDGRFKVRKDGKFIDFRVSIFPGMYGEKIVMRLLDDSNLVLGMDKLGFDKNDLTIILAAICKTKGMILVTGPTGSGKTTTIYSMLHDLNDGTLNISTAEDPVEYNLKGVNQFQMSAKIGLNFARALRTFLRQDPDIIMVGEIRDLETAEIAFKAALTGHLVLSTLHTNSAPETITRLLDIGIEPYIIASSLNLIVAQRLIRKNCEKCGVAAVPTAPQMNVFLSYGLSVNGHRFVQGKGCNECNGTGFKGRIAIYEVMPLSVELRELIIKGKSSFEIKAKAEEMGCTSLQTQGFQRLTAGIISPSEWVRVLA